MNRLAAAFTGHTVLDAEALWTELCGLPGPAAAARLEKPWAVSGAELRAEDMLGFALPDGTTWQFSRETSYRRGADLRPDRGRRHNRALFSQPELYEKNRR
jgi:hypothetical protein